MFGCKCFILKHAILDKFESRSSDGIFLGYGSHSRAYRVLNLETNGVMETCGVTFDETMPCTAPIFESAGEDELGESIFVEEEQEDANWGDPELTPMATPLEPAVTTSAHGPNPSTSTSWRPVQKLPQPMPAATEEAITAIEGRQLPQGRHHDTFCIAIHLTP